MAERVRMPERWLLADPNMSIPTQIIMNNINGHYYKGGRITIRSM